MNKSNYEFCLRVASIMQSYSQFSHDLCNWIACQFALESSFGESSLAHSKNNYCGMKNPLVRISTSLYAGLTGYFWAEYDDLEHCCLDYLLCVQFYRPKFIDYNSIVHYAAFIKNFYCPEADYIDKINSIYSQFKSFKNEK